MNDDRGEDTKPAEHHERESGQEDDDYDRPSPFGWFPIVMLILLVGGGLYFMFALRDVSNIQDCVQSGRKNCAPIDTSNLP